MCCLMYFVDNIGYNLVRKVWKIKDNLHRPVEFWSYDTLWEYFCPCKKATRSFKGNKTWSRKIKGNRSHGWSNKQIFLDTKNFSRALVDLLLGLFLFVLFLLFLLIFILKHIKLLNMQKYLHL